MYFFLAHNVLQVYNFDTKNMLNEVELLHEVVFWKWVNEETIMMVTEKSAHYWAVFRGKPTHYVNNLTMQANSLCK